MSQNREQEAPQSLETQAPVEPKLSPEKIKLILANLELAESTIDSLKPAQQVTRKTLNLEMD